MVHFLADEFLRITATLNRLEMIVEGWARYTEPLFLTDDDVTSLSANLEEIQFHADHLSLEPALHRLERFRNALVVGMNMPDLKYQLQALRESVEDSVRGRVFFSLDRQSAELYDSYAPFGDEVLLAFEAMQVDIEEAARCLSLDRSTACVFHLMRVMEVAVRHLGTKTGVRLKAAKPTKNGRVVTDTPRTWNELSQEIRKKVDQWSSRTAKQRRKKEQHIELLAFLDSVRQAWRNPTMHPRASYERDEAAEIFSAVRVFLQRLAALELAF